MSNSPDDKGLFAREHMGKILKQLGRFESLFLVISPKKHEESLTFFTITFLALLFLFCFVFFLLVLSESQIWILIGK